MTLTELKEQVSLAGWTPSAGSWEDDRIIVAFSVEGHGPATYGHPCFSLHHIKETWQTFHDNREYQLLGRITDQYSLMGGSPA